MTIWQRIKNDWPMAFIGTPILLFIGVYCLTSDDIDPVAGAVMGIVFLLIAAGAWAFGILKR